MKRRTIMIPEDLKIRAARRANAVGISLGGFIRESIERALNSDGKVALDDPYLSDNSVYQDDIPADLAQNHDKYLLGIRKQFNLCPLTPLLFQPSAS